MLLEPMQVDESVEDGTNVQSVSIVVENPTLDLEAYANQYASLARLHRLIFVADVCPSLAVEALKMAITYVKTTYNVSLYTALHQRLRELLQCNGSAPESTNGGETPAGPVPDLTAQHSATHKDLPPYDHNWVETRTKKAAMIAEKLDSDLKNYKANSIKESIRRGHDDLADHYLSCGELTSASKCYARARDYCTSGKHVVGMCLNVIKVSIYLQNWSHVASFVLKAENTPEFAMIAEAGSKDTNSAVHTRLQCASGLANLQCYKYKSAAKLFLSANFDHVDFPEMISPNNVAIYGGMCALATYDRQELKKHVIQSSSFKLFLELEPQLRDIIFFFHESKYAACLTLLAEIRDNLLLDIYMAAHVNALYTKIRNRALIQYLSPYQSADMAKMAEAFRCSIEALENELVQLILDGQIQVRIDSYRKIIYADEDDERKTIFEHALAVGENYKKQYRMFQLRAAISKADVHVKSPSRDCNNSA